MAFAVKKYATLLTDMTNWMIANQTKVTDFNEGSIIRTLIEVVALEIEQLYNKTRVGYERELKNAPFAAFDFTIKGAQSSAGTVIFSRAGTSGTVDIAAGTLISTDDGIQFETTAAGQITNGNQDSAAIAIAAIKAGKESNVAANLINTIVTPITGVDSVDNAAATTGGLDQESDADYLNRFRDYIEGLGQSNGAGLRYGAKTVVGVRSASIVEHFPPDSGYNVTVYIDDGAGNASQALIDAVTLVLIGDGTDANPGYKADGVNLRVLAPTKVNVSVTVAVTDDGTVSQEALDYLILQAVQDYINNLAIGEDVIYNKIVEVIMAVDGVANISLTVPASDTPVAAAQIARTDSSIISIGYV